jgi:hypothetical protein
MLPLWERILLFLAVAMMESLGISVKISAEPDLADADGFMLLPGKRAVIATWVRAEEIWQAGITTALGDFSSPVQEFANSRALDSTVQKNLPPRERLRVRGTAAHSVRRPPAADNATPAEDRHRSVHLYDRADSMTGIGLRYLGRA